MLSHGALVGEGETGEVVRIFREGLMEEGSGMATTEPATGSANEAPIPASIATPDSGRPVRLTEITQSHPGDGARAYLRTGEALTVNVGFHANIACDDVVFSIEVHNDEGVVLMHTDTSIIGHTFSVPSGPGVIQMRLKDLPMLDGDFSYCIGIQSRGGLQYDWCEPAGKFEIMNAGKTTGSIHMPVEVALLAADPPAATELLSPQAAPLR